MRVGTMLGVLAASILGAAGPPALTPAEKAAGWRLLFDGHSFTGWHDPARMSPPGDSWIIEDGCLKAMARARFREDLISLDSFADFELVFDWKITRGGNSGVKYRIQDFANLPGGLIERRGQFEAAAGEALEHKVERSRAAAGPGGQQYVVGFEYQIIDDASHADARRGGKYQAGAVYQLFAPSKAAARRVGEFNHSRIVVKGDRLQHYLNGHSVVDASLEDPAAGQALLGRWGLKSPVYKLLIARPKRATPIALQNHESDVWFRNIKARMLRAE